MLGMFCVWIWGVVPGLCSVDSLYSHEVCAGLHRLALIHSLRMATCDESHARSEPCGGPGGQLGFLPISSSHQASLGWEELHLCSETVGSASQDPVKVHL